MLNFANQSTTLMPTYYLDKRKNSLGIYELHEETCSRMPEAAHAVYIGNFSNCKAAMATAAMSYSPVAGCARCSPDCKR
jgi:hypothetical protein